jgi:hypothetical protein
VFELLADGFEEALDEALAASSADARVSSAEARSALACTTAASRSVVSMVASTSPAVTDSPTATSTDVTVPDAGNDTDAWLTFETVPLADRVWVTAPVVAVAVV